jgi:hypothetical protein
VQDLADERGCIRSHIRRLKAYGLVVDRSAGGGRRMIQRRHGRIVVLQGVDFSPMLAAADSLELAALEVEAELDERRQLAARVSELKRQLRAAIVVEGTAATAPLPRSRPARRAIGHSRSVIWRRWSAGSPRPSPTASRSPIPTSVGGEPYVSPAFLPNPLGNAPAHRLFERVRVGRRVDGEFREIDARLDNLPPARRFPDYAVEIDRGDLPAGVEVLEFL